jgi:hypothetical protein
MSWLTVILIILSSIAAFPAIILVVRDTLRGTGKWGINTGGVNCPRCSYPFPRIRRPRNERQRLWGGWTCPRCATEVDKWGIRVEDAE